MTTEENITETPGVVEGGSFAIDAFLTTEAAKDLLRFSTAGSVDDGKSTLIGRLLYDSRNVYEDQVRAVTGKVAGNSGLGGKNPAIDLAQLTDGLRAEREQGITIDVAYRYFSTQNRKFIIADTPGHEQYTRNMATGASTADLAIILIDARKGILTQSRRHAYIASLLGTRHLVAAINKMDLVDFSEDVYNRITTDLHAMLHQIAQQVAGCDLVTIPVSALLGDNVVDRSQHMPWYDGPTLLEHLESVAVWNDAGQLPFRLAVQRVIRPHQHYRGFAGQISAGTIRVGDLVTALPSGRSSRVTSITTFDGDLGQASAPLSIALTLEEELDISRGDLLAEPDRLPQQATIIEASLVWFDVKRLDTHRPYLLKHGASILNARVTRVLSRTNVETLADEAVATLGMNDIGLAHIALTLPLHFDPYTTNRASGSFILIDPQTNATLAAGMIRRGLATGKPSQHRKAALLIASNTTIDVAGLETALLSDGALVVTTRVADPATLRSLLALGLVVLFEGATAPPDIGDVTTMDLSAYKNSEEVLHLLQTDGVLIAPPGGDHAR